MSLNLFKGQEINLTQENPDVSSIFVGIGWDMNDDSTEDYDLDASALLVSKTGKVEKITDLIFYANLQDSSGAVVHTGDNRTGRGEGDDEAILVDLTKVPDYVDKIAFVASIYDGVERGQSFGQVKNAYIRIFDETDVSEVFRYDLAGDFSGETAVVFGELCKEEGDWKFYAQGKGFGGGLAEVCAFYGVGRK